LSAVAQAVIWSPRANPACLILEPPPRFLRDQTPVDADTSPPQHAPEGVYAIHRAADGAQIVFVGDPGEGSPLAAVIALDDDTLTRIEALARFWRAWQRRHVPADNRVTPQQRRRLRLMMRAVDGRTAQATYREIAIALYGVDRVAAEPWKTSALRDTVIGLAEGGAAMIAGGYLKLLRRRRR
jgi:hypothetical protein